MPTNAAPKNKKNISPVPAYQRIEEDIRAQVRDGRLLPGQMLASRRNLTLEYGVALSTVQQAIANLVADGTLEASDRRGTFVAVRNEAADPTPAAISESAVESRAVVSSILRPGLGEPVIHTTGTLGIVSTARIQPEGADDVGSLWARLAIRSIERIFSAAGGATCFFDRFPEERGPYARGFDDANAISMPDAIAALRLRGADALAIIGLCDSRDMSDEIVTSVDIEKTPTVYISWHEIRPPLAHVYYDNRLAGYQAAQHLLHKRYQRLTFLAPFAEKWLVERIEGAGDAVRHAGLHPAVLQTYPAEPSLAVYDENLAVSEIREAAQHVLTAELTPNSAPTKRLGIIAPNDHTAHVVLEVAARLNLTPGVDFGLIGFDDEDRSCTLGLTTVRPPVEAMGEEAGRILLRSLSGGDGGVQIRLRSQVITRGSTSLRPESARE
jgi:DNA-binding LacI/PurR family transcriptional regulator/DNA-binding transcriptional regulator YhcF (GntR family)